MKRLTLRPGVELIADECYDLDEKKDTHTIVNACFDEGYQIDFNTARSAWEEYSATDNAGWMVLPQFKQSIVKLIMPFLNVMEVEAV